MKVINRFYNMTPSSISLIKIKTTFNLIHHLHFFNKFAKIILKTKNQTFYSN